jgi:diketogulonate reductase-like aldo/keto reductase
MQEVIKAETIQRKDIFVTTKLWNNNHRPDRVKPAFEASRQRLQLDYVDCYLIHTPLPSSRATSKTQGTSTAR